jgi:hypothetical protein
VESYTTNGTDSLDYWHIHPLLTFSLRQIIAAYAEKAAGKGILSLFRSAYWGLADFYEKRLFEFDDSNVEIAKISRTKILLELDNISNALDLYFQMDVSDKYSSMILLRLAQSFNLATLPRQEYRKILGIFERTTSRYSEILLKDPDPEMFSGFRQAQLDNFVKAAGTLQNMYFATEDWALARKYAGMIETVLGANSNLIQESTYLTAHLAQTAMVRGFETFESGAIKKAKFIFSTNLAKPEPPNQTPERKMAYAKIRFMNNLGLLKCAMEDPGDHPKELMDVFAVFEKSAIEWQEISQNFEYGKGWADEDSHGLRILANMRRGLEFTQKYYFADEIPVCHCP